jgi:uncharacterized protein (DUF302 family)
MELESFSQVQAAPRAFDSTLKSLRRLLNDAGLRVVRQLDLSRDFPGQLAAGARNCALLMVDSPLLLFEAVALDRSAAVFIPLHIVITGDQHSTCIHWAHPAETIGFRMSATAKGPVDALYTRLTQVLRGAGSWPDQGGNDEVR